MHAGPEDADIENRPTGPGVRGRTGTQEGQMSASTRTVQQNALGSGQIWAALAVVTLALIVALAIAFASKVETTSSVTPAGVGQPPPALTDHGWSQTGTSKEYAGASSTDIDGIDHGARDDLATGAAPQSRGGINAGSNGPQRRAQ